MAADRANERNIRHGSPPRCKRTAVAPAPSLLLLRGDGRDRSSGVYRCPGRQLGVLRFALRETVPFSVFRLLSLRIRCSRYRISRVRARARLAPLSRRRRFLPEGSISTPVVSDDSCDLNPAYTCLTTYPL